MTFEMTQHAAVRTQQRGVPHHLIDALMSYACAAAWKKDPLSGVIGA